MRMNETLQIMTPFLGVPEISAARNFVYLYTNYLLRELLYYLISVWSNYIHKS